MPSSPLNIGRPQRTSYRALMQYVAYSAGAVTCCCWRLFLAVSSLQELRNLSEYALGMQIGLAQTFTPGAMLDKCIGQADVEYGD